MSIDPYSQPRLLASVEAGTLEAAHQQAIGAAADFYALPPDLVDVRYLGASTTVTSDGIRTYQVDFEAIPLLRLRRSGTQGGPEHG